VRRRPISSVLRLPRGGWRAALATLQVLAERSASKATSAAACIEAFRSCLQALNAAHTALIAGNWDWVSLASLTKTALATYLGVGDRIRLDVRDLRLNPSWRICPFLCSSSRSMLR
jgi:HWE histidine kinase